MDIFFLIAGPLIVWAIASYNLLLRDKNRVLSAWGNIDDQLMRRFDLIFELVDNIKHYVRYEQATLRAITSMRQHPTDLINASQRGKFEANFSTHIKRLMTIADAYPELKTSQHLLALQQELSKVENDIRLARRDYNGAVRDLNTRIDRFPDNLIARLFNLTQHDYFQPDSHAGTTPPERNRGGLQNSHC